MYVGMGLDDPLCRSQLIAGVDLIALRLRFIRPPSLVGVSGEDPLCQLQWIVEVNVIAI